MTRRMQPLLTQRKRQLAGVKEAFLVDKCKALALRRGDNPNVASSCPPGARRTHFEKDENL